MSKIRMGALICLSLTTISNSSEVRESSDTEISQQQVEILSAGVTYELKSLTVHQLKQLPASIQHEIKDGLYYYLSFDGLLTDKNTIYLLKGETLEGYGCSITGAILKRTADGSMKNFTGKQICGNAMAVIALLNSKSK